MILRKTVQALVRKINCVRAQRTTGRKQSATLGARAADTSLRLTLVDRRGRFGSLSLSGHS
jgi:hypothetical protein